MICTELPGKSLLVYFMILSWLICLSFHSIIPTIILCKVKIKVQYKKYNTPSTPLLWEISCFFKPKFWLSINSWKKHFSKNSFLRLQFQAKNQFQRPYVMRSSKMSLKSKILVNCFLAFSIRVLLKLQFGENPMKIRQLVLEL